MAAADGRPARPLQTGQTTCYDANGNPTGCAESDQDGALQAGVARRYIDNGDGTVSDASTGLIWEKKSADGSIHDQGRQYSWSDAFTAFIAELNSTHFAGHTDWRLPNVNELQTLVDYGEAGPVIDPAFNTACVAGCTALACSCTQSSSYWSSTTVAIAPAGAWFVGFGYGHVNFNPKAASYHVRAVCGGLRLQTDYLPPTAQLSPSGRN